MLQRIFRGWNCLLIAFFEFFKPVRDIGDDGHLVLHTIVSGPCTAEIRPTAAGIAGREPTVFYKDMIGIDLPQFRNNAVDLFLFTINDNPKTGLLDHCPLRDLIGT